MNGKNQSVHTGCDCGNADYCNSKSLLAAGTKQIAALPMISCSLGSAGTAKGQFCYWQNVTIGNVTRITRQVTSYTVDVAKPQLGCLTSYGVSAARITIVRSELKLIMYSIYYCTHDLLVQLCDSKLQPKWSHFNATTDDSANENNNAIQDNGAYKNSGAT